jgi:hypothetical protein
MGEVGSTSLWRALEQRTDVAPFRAHILSAAGRAAWREWGRDGLFTPNRRYRAANALDRHLIAPGRPLKVITMIRDPIDRDISDFFENAVREVACPVDELVASFLATFDPLRAEKWYREEFAGTLGIDVLAHPFDAAGGTSRISEPPYEVLVLRTTLPDDVKAERIADFLGVRELAIPRANRTADKPVNALYQAFRHALKLPPDTLRAATENAFTRHFFAPGEIEAMRARWGS